MSQASQPDVERIVGERYSDAAQEREEALCCPVVYDTRYLEAIPQEVIERDYGCGDPSRYVRAGETVLDLGSGGGKICFIASQIVGPAGRVIGVDTNDEMLALARSAAPVVAERVGYANTEFHRGRIQDLRLDVGRVDAWLAEHPVRSAADLSALEDTCARLREEAPLVPDGSVDLVVSNCVLNLVRTEDKTKLVREIFRVLRPGGRIAISDIVSDAPVPDALRADPELWSGCVSGAFEEREILDELAAAGFRGMAFDAWTDEPFRVVEGIEFRSVTVTAVRPVEAPCGEDVELIYRGPWRQVEDDTGRILRRGERLRVAPAEAARLRTEPYEGQLIEVGAKSDAAPSKGCC